MRSNYSQSNSLYPSLRPTAGTLGGPLYVFNREVPQIVVGKCSVSAPKHLLMTSVTKQLVCPAIMDARALISWVSGSNTACWWACRIVAQTVLCNKRSSDFHRIASFCGKPQRMPLGVVKLPSRIPVSPHNGLCGSHRNTSMLLANAPHVQMNLLCERVDELLLPQRELHGQVSCDLCELWEPQSPGPIRRYQKQKELSHFPQLLQDFG